MSCLGIGNKSFSKLLRLFCDLALDRRQQNYINCNLKKSATRTIYYILCCRGILSIAPTIPLSDAKFLNIAVMALFIVYAADIYYAKLHVFFIRNLPQGLGLKVS